MKPASGPQINVDRHQGLLACFGDWTIDHLSHLTKQLKKLSKEALEVTQIDCSHIDELDSAGALVLANLLADFKKRKMKVRLSGLKERYRNLLQFVISEDQNIHRAPKMPERPDWFYIIGESAYEKYKNCRDFLGFLGEYTATFFRILFNPVRFQWSAIVQTIDEVGYQALGIVALLSFLIGIVLTYQISLELKTYGANIYVVDLVGLIIAREFGPLITAIIAAGRTSTAFTAQLGTMKVNEEIDALRTMGISPMQRLVVPKIMGALIAIPLLTVWSDIFGVLGGMFMSKQILGIGYIAFLNRFHHVFAVKEYYMGLIKSPFFAVLIAAVGCFQAFQVGTSADSVGRQTTKAAVQAIFLVVIADAVFSIIYSIGGF